MLVSSLQLQGVIDLDLYPLFRILDHQAIYLLIAGTYTPFILVTLHGSVGWWLFGVIWGLALFGIALDAVHPGGKRIVPLIVYFVMG